MTGRIWVITGTSSGIGLDIAEYVLRQGDKVIATVRSIAKFPATLRTAGAYPLILDLDASDEVVKSAAEEAIRVYGHVDVLVNNAGTNIPAFGPVEEISTQDIRQLFQSNLFGTIAFTQPFIAHFRTRRSGHILNVTSVGAATFAPSWGAYCATKVALEAFTDALAKELSLFGVRVHILMPGYFPTDIFRKHPAYVENESAASDARASTTTVYTDRETQGFDSMSWLPRVAESLGHVGDPQKLAVRVYEIVANVGLAKQVMERYAGKGWIRIICGTGCGELALAKYTDNLENIKAYEALWKSMDIDQQESTTSSRL